MLNAQNPELSAQGVCHGEAVSFLIESDRAWAREVFKGSLIDAEAILSGR